MCGTLESASMDQIGMIPSTHHAVNLEPLGRAGPTVKGFPFAWGPAMSTDGELSDKERYQRYLAGREWGLLKQQVKARSGGICERCKINPSDAVHHLTYERKYNERLEDLQDTCEACHKFTHGLSGEDPLMTGIPVTLTGVFVSRYQFMVFFLRDDIGHFMPDNEYSMGCWEYEASTLIRQLIGDDYPSKNTRYHSHFPLRLLLGRKYRMIKHIKQTAIELIRDTSRQPGLEDWHAKDSFVFSCDTTIDLYD